MTSWSDNPILREYAARHPPPECPEPRRRYVFRDGRVIQSREYRQWIDDMEQWELEGLNQLMQDGGRSVSEHPEPPLADYKLTAVMVRCDQCGFRGWVDHTDWRTDPKCPNCGGDDERSGRQE